MFDSTKNEISELIKSLTQSYPHIELTKYTAQSIADELKISRNLASQYLNDLHKEGALIKIQSRPVYFFDKLQIELYAFSSLPDSSFLSLAEFQNTLDALRNANTNFKKAIGHNGSLSYCIEQLITAVSYPNFSLPVLLTGETGVGKTYLAKLLFEYAQERGIVQSKEDLCFIDSSFYIDSPDKFQKLLRSFRLNTQTRILLFDDIHILPVQCQEQLMGFLDSCMGSSPEKRINFLHLIFTASENLDFRMERKLKNRIPSVLQVPSLDSRSIEEKEELLYHFYKAEGKALHLEILLSHAAYSAFMQYSFRGNISELRNAIHISVANALQNFPQAGKELSVFLYDLPAFLIENTGAFESESSPMLSISQYAPKKYSNETLSYYTQLISKWESNSASSHIKDFFSDAFLILSRYHDYLLFENQYNQTKSDAFEKTCATILSDISERYDIYFPSNYSKILSRSIANQIQFKFSIQKWIQENSQALQEIIDACEDILKKESNICDEISHRMRCITDYKMDTMEKIMLLLTLHFYNQDIKSLSTIGIIIAHGFSTASSIADVANELLGQHVFEAFNMPLNVRTPDIAKQIKKRISYRKNIHNLILLVDMGSLQDLGLYLQDIPNINIGIANNISTGLALDIGSHIINGSGMELLFKECCSSHSIQFHILQNKKKEKAILFTSENGNKVTEKIVELFTNSLPRKTHIHLIPYDYKKLLTTGSQDGIFDNYEILFVCGTLNPSIEQVPFFPLDNIFSSSEIDTIASALYPYLNNEEMRQLKNNLLVNFSLQNIIGYLSVLDVSTVIQYVNEALQLLQKLFHITIDFTISISLFIHISCMIERLVTNSQIDGDPDFSSFSEQERHHLDLIRSAFKSICTHYHVTIPLYELDCIYQYIQEFM